MGITDIKARCSCGRGRTRRGAKWGGLYAYALDCVGLLSTFGIVCFFLVWNWFYSLNISFVLPETIIFPSSCFLFLSSLILILLRDLNSLIFWYFNVFIFLVELHHVFSLKSYIAILYFFFYIIVVFKVEKVCEWDDRILVI